MTATATMSITAAVRKAREDVSMYEVGPIAGGHRGYVVSTYEAVYDAVVESEPTWHAKAALLKRTAIVTRACDLLEVPSTAFAADPLRYEGMSVEQVVRRLAA